MRCPYTTLDARLISACGSKPTTCHSGFVPSAVQTQDVPEDLPQQLPNGEQAT